MSDQKCYNSFCLSSTIEIAKSSFSLLLKNHKKELLSTIMLNTTLEKCLRHTTYFCHAVDSSNNFSFSNEELPLTIAKTSSKSPLSASCC